jgi:predicted O-methyltransferase YrrM
MRYLEELDARDRIDGTPQTHRLRQIPAESGRFIALLAASAPEGTCLEIGTSAGYSTLWLALACGELGRHLTTIELSPDKAEMARETFRSTALDEIVELIEGDALDYLRQASDIAFCFLGCTVAFYKQSDKRRECRHCGGADRERRTRLSQARSTAD